MTDTADDLDILAPDRDLVVGGETVTVRELRFGEFLRLAGRLGPFQAALLEVFRADRATVDAIHEVMEAHYDAVLDAVAGSIGKDRAWVEQLAPEEGEDLLLAWWEVHMDFFVRRLALRKVAAAEAKARMDGEPSASGSGITATAETSSPTPTVS